MTSDARLTPPATRVDSITSGTRVDAIASGTHVDAITSGTHVDAIASGTRVDAIHRGARHVRVWLAATGFSYDAAAREVFVRAHPVLFGHAYDVTLRGYEQWRWRHGLVDTVDGFARYMARRHQRWIDTHAVNPSLAPCLLGTPTSDPCWKISTTTAGRVDLNPAA